MNNRALPVLGALVVALLFGWAGFRFYEARLPAAPVLATPAGQASPPSLTDLAPETAPPTTAIPERVPDFVLKDLKGRPTPIRQWAGKALILNFWATWCAPCRREIPLLKSLASSFAERDIVTVGIAVDYPDKVQDFADQYHIGYPLLVGEQDALDVAASLGVTTPAFPFTVFTDKRGNIIALTVGELHRPQLDLIMASIEQIETGGLALPAARQQIAEGLASLAKKQAPGDT